MALEAIRCKPICEVNLCVIHPVDWRQTAIIRRGGLFWNFSNIVPKCWNLKGARQSQNLRYVWYPNTRISGASNPVTSSTCVRAGEWNKLPTVIRRTQSRSFNLQCTYSGTPGSSNTRIRLRVSMEVFFLSQPNAAIDGHFWVYLRRDIFLELRSRDFHMV